MDLDQLHTFLEIVRLKSFSKAAQTCFRTQPAISAQVRQLEQELNTTLFDRLGTRIALTTAGRIFADYSYQILELRKQAQDAIDDFGSAFETAYVSGLRRKLGLFQPRADDPALIQDLLERMAENGADFTLTFRGLCMRPQAPMATRRCAGCSRTETRSTVGRRNGARGLAKTAVMRPRDATRCAR
jgi:DNA-binding transcriptional LysR family regulator